MSTIYDHFYHSLSTSSSEHPLCILFSIYRHEQLKQDTKLPVLSAVPVKSFILETVFFNKNDKKTKNIQTEKHWDDYGSIVQ